MKKITYLAHYSDYNKGEKRNCSPAGCNVIEYVVKTLDQDGYSVQLISASNSICKHSYPSYFEAKYNNSTVKYFHGFGFKNKIEKVFSILLFKTNRLIWLLKHIKKTDTVMVYHSLELMNCVRILKRVRKCKIILQVAEIYADVVNSSKAREKELSYFKLADGYIFQNDLLNALINKDGKPFAVNYGSYSLPEKICTQSFPTNEVHCVYAGTLDPNKGGASYAVDSALFLPDNYHIHILGFGNDNEERRLLERIETVSEKASAKVTFDGTLSGDAYIFFLQQCQIGLCTQNPTAAFNGTSFPSKILSYLSNGLNVVCCNIEAVKKSKVSSLISFYDNPLPKDIAKAILSVSTEKTNATEIISALSNDFKNSMNDMIEKLNCSKKEV